MFLPKVLGHLIYGAACGERSKKNDSQCGADFFFLPHKDPYLIAIPYIYHRYTY